jgi:hypothetical protein
MILGSIRSFSVRRQYLPVNANLVPLIDDVSFQSRGFAYHIGPDGGLLISSDASLSLTCRTAYVAHSRDLWGAGGHGFQFAVAHCTAPA